MEGFDMSLIPCIEPCVYQADGYCGLERAASLGTPELTENNCLHFIGKTKRENSEMSYS